MPSAPVTLDPSALLWHDRDLIAGRYEKSAYALAAICRTLARRRPLAGGEDELLRCYARLAAADSAAFTAVWSHPRAYFWTRIAYQLVGAAVSGAPLTPLGQAYVAAVGTSTPAGALAHHLDTFREFCLALALAEGSDWELETPWRTTLPCTLGPARWALHGPGTIELLGVRGGRVHLRHGQQLAELSPEDGDIVTGSGLALRHCPVARHGGCALPLHPEAFALPGLDIAPAVLEAGRSYQERHVGLVGDALAAIARYAPEVFAQIRDDLCVTALKPRSLGPFTNVSYSELPGACIVSVTAHPLVLADRLIHELHHNRLFAIEEHGAFFERTPGSRSTDACHYSPWRNDLRPVHGLFHAVYVYVAVLRFWMRVHEQGESAPDDRRIALERLLKVPAELAIAVGILARHADFTPFGRTLFDRLAADVADLRATLAGWALPDDVPALAVAEDGTLGPRLDEETASRPLGVREAVAEHVRLHDLRGDVAGLGAAGARAAS